VSRHRRQRICLTFAPVDAIEVTLDVDASLKVLRAERLAVLERVARRLLDREPDATGNSFYAIVGGRKADALEAFSAAKDALQGVGTDLGTPTADSDRSGAGPANEIEEVGS